MAYPDTLRDGGGEQSCKGNKALFLTVVGRGWLTFRPAVLVRLECLLPVVGFFRFLRESKDEG